MPVGNDTTLHRSAPSESGTSVLRFTDTQASVGQENRDTDSGELRGPVASPREFVAPT
jgi:hypothetical protein